MSVFSNIFQKIFFFLAKKNTYLAFFFEVILQGEYIQYLPIFYVTNTLSKLQRNL